MNEAVVTPQQQESKIAGNTKTADFKTLFPSREQLTAAMEEDYGSSIPSAKVSSQAQSDNTPSDSEKHPGQLNTDQSQVEFEKTERNPQTETAKKEFTDAEKDAFEKGWKPKNTYQGPDDKWVSANEFLVRGKMIAEIDQYKKEVSKMSKAQEALLELVKKQSKRSEERALQVNEEKADEYLKKKRTAITEGDIEEAEKYEQKYHQRQQEINSFKDLELKTKANSEVSPEAYEFAERNKSWFNNNTPENCAMYEYAVKHDDDLLKRYPHWPIIRRLEEVELRVKSFFKDKFENPQRSKAALVESSHPRPPSDPSKIGYKDLPREAKIVVDKFINMVRPSKKSKNMISRDEYARQLLITGAIKYE